MKIIKLVAQNILRLVAVEIIPGDRPVIQLTGKNGAGKSSVLNAIWMALGGEETVPSKPIHKGAEKGKVEIDLGEIDMPQYTVKRSFTEKGSYLTVTGKDGATFPSPQALLDKLVGELTFDPLEFTRMRPTLQLEELARITPLDVDKKKLVEITGADLTLTRGGPLELLNYYEEEFKNQRTLVSRDADKARTAADLAWKDAPETPPKEIAVKDLLAQRKALEEEAAKRRERESTSMYAHGERNKLGNDLKVCREDIAVHEQKLDVLKKREQELTNKHAVAQRAAAESVEMIGPPVLFDTIDEQLEKAEGVNKLAAAHARAKELEDKAQSAEGIAAGVLERLTAIRSYRNAVQAAAKFPIEGLAFGDGEVLLNGLPFKQASDAEQLRVSIAVAMAANPKLRVIRVRDGSLLDSEGMKMLEELAKEKDFQVWIETVGEDKTVGVHIEDGQVVPQA